MSLAYESWENELTIDALVIVHNYLYSIEQSIRREFKPLIVPKRVGLNFLQREMEPEITPLLRICNELSSQRCVLQLLCRRISSYARRISNTGYLDRKIGMEIAGRALIRRLKTKIKNNAYCLCLARERELVEKQYPLKIKQRDLPMDFQKLVEDHPIDFKELVECMDACTPDDLHKEKLDALMVYDPKRKCLVPSRFCSIHLAGFDLDEKSTAEVGPPYEPGPLPSGTRLTKYVAANKHYQLADYSTEVISIRVVKVGPDYTYPVEVYGKVIARDEIDYKCVYLFDRERKDAQTIKSEKDMLALTGPYRALVTLGFMYFEFDLKIKGKGDHDDEVQFSKGVLDYYCNPDDKRIILQLPSFQSTVKLVLQHVAVPVAASLEVRVVNKVSNDPPVHFDGKITAGTTKNYRHHTVLYDSSVGSWNLVGENGSLVLNRKLVAVHGYAQGRAYAKDELLVLYVCFLDASCEIEDKDKMDPEEEDCEEEEEKEEEEDEEEEKEEGDHENVVTLAVTYPERETVLEHGCFKLEVQKKEEEEEEEKEEEDPENVVTLPLTYPERETVLEHGCPKLEVKEKEEEEEEEEEEEKEEDPENVVTLALRYPDRKTVLEHGCSKLEVKVNWTAVLDRPEGTDEISIYSSVPDGCSIDYRYGICYE